MSRRDAQIRTRRGIALLLVLAAASGAAVSASIIASSRTDSMTAARQAELLRQADALADAAHDAAHWWLRRASGTIVLPPDAPAPRVPVFDHTIELPDGVTARIRVTAFDQLGMTPIQLADFPHAAAITGLDQISPDRHTQGLSPFPDHDERSSSTLGERFATHNAAGDQHPAGRLNIHTAPIALLQSATEETGDDRLAQIIRARAAGRRATNVGVVRHDRARRVPTLVAGSNAWSFRIEAQAGGVSSAWWSTYIHRGADWELVQRLPITR